MDFAIFPVLVIVYNLDNYAYNIAIYVTLNVERYACVVRKFCLISYTVWTIFNKINTDVKKYLFELFWPILKICLEAYFWETMSKITA